MVAYNFRGEFADMVASGRKHSTIRPAGKRRRTRPGEPLQLYTGQRTSQCRLLREVVCVEVNDVVIHADHIVLDDVTWRGLGANQIAKLDGFETLAEMAGFFESVHGALPFRGVRVTW